jgi:hypothetical protein
MTTKKLDNAFSQEILMKYFVSHTKIASVVKAKKALESAPNNGCEPLDIAALTNVLDFTVKQAWDSLTNRQKHYWIGRLVFELQFNLASVCDREGN